MTDFVYKRPTYLHPIHSPEEHTKYFENTLKEEKGGVFIENKRELHKCNTCEKMLIIPVAK